MVFVRLERQLPGCLRRHVEFLADEHVRPVVEADGLPRHLRDTFEMALFFVFFSPFSTASESLIDGLLHVLGVKSSQDHFWRFQLKTNSELKGPKKIPGRRR